MLFVSFHELIPMAKRYGHREMFSVGMVFSVLVYALLARMTVGQIAWATP
jgi:hypothetical protein